MLHDDGHRNRSQKKTRQMATVPCRNVGSTEPCRRLPRVPLACILTAVVVLLAVAVPPAHAVCPAMDSHCHCQRKFSWSDHLYCEGLGNVSRVPEFRESTTIYDTLQIRFETTLMTLQANAFKGVQARQIMLQVRPINRIPTHRQTAPD